MANRVSRDHLAFTLHEFGTHWPYSISAQFALSFAVILLYGVMLTDLSKIHVCMVYELIFLGITSLAQWRSEAYLGVNEVTHDFYSLIRCHLTCIGIPVINLRQSDGRLRIITGIPIRIRRRLVNHLKPWRTWEKINRYQAIPQHNAT